MSSNSSKTSRAAAGRGSCASCGTHCSASYSRQHDQSHLNPYAYPYHYSYSSHPSPASTFASSTSSSFAFRSSPPVFLNHHRSYSPTRVDLVRSVHPAPSVRFAFDPRSISPGRYVTASSERDHRRHHDHHHHHHHHQILNQHSPQPRRMMCMCSPTTHPGSFRCSLHKNTGFHGSLSAPSNRLNARRSAMTNSLVRIGTVEGEWVKRALAALIRPSSHHQRRRADFQPRPSRLSVMSKAEDRDLC